MREVRACDFCGEAAVGVFEVLPAGVVDDEPKRMVLCEGCEGTLSGVVDPLLDARAEAAEAPLVAEAEPAAEPADDGEAGTETESTTDEAADGGEAGDDGTTSAGEDEGENGPVHEAGGRPTRNRSGTPKGYSKVMRFLEGREFPMEREAAETMVVEAYGMDGATVEAAIDHAAKHGRIRVASGKLFR
jgi:hypothetical protein